MRCVAACRSANVFPGRRRPRRKFAGALPVLRAVILVRPATRVSAPVTVVVPLPSVTSTLCVAASSRPTPLAAASPRLASIATAMQAPMPDRSPRRLPDPCALIVAPARCLAWSEGPSRSRSSVAGSREASSRPPVRRADKRRGSPAATTSLEHGGNGHGSLKPAELSGEARRGFVRRLDGRYGLPGKRTSSRVGRQFKPPDSASSAETAAPCRQPALGPESAAGRASEGSARASYRP